MDGETKLRDLRELKIGRAIGILDIWRVTEHLWKLAYCFHPEGGDEAEAFVETYLGEGPDGTDGHALADRWRPGRSESTSHLRQRRLGAVSR